MQPFLHAGGRDRQMATASLYDLCLKRDAVNAANMDVPLTFGTERESVRGLRRSGHPKLQVIQCFGTFKASGRPKLQVTQGFGPPKDPGHPRIRVAQCFRSFEISGRSRLRTAQGFGSSKTSGRPNLRVPSFAYEKIERGGGYSPFSTIEFDADVKKSLLRES